MFTVDFRDEIAKEDNIDSFSVTLCARESLSVLQSFVDHYQLAGAEQIFLYIDDEKDVSDAVAAALAPYAFVTVQGCDEAFWKEAYPDERVPSLPQKQQVLYSRAIGLNTSDWLFFCDADEFIVGDRPIGKALAQVSDDILGVRLMNSEAVWGPGDDIGQPYGCSYERLSFGVSRQVKSRKKRFLRAVFAMLVYGRDWREMIKGIAGHSMGKHFLRRGVHPERMNSHFSFIAGTRIPYLPQDIRMQHNWRVVHFDAISFGRWQEKWQGRLSGSTNTGRIGASRVAQLDATRRAFQNGKPQRLFRRFYVLNRWQQFVLMRFGLLKRLHN
ncbi:glycosyltransferase family 2 protein [Aliiroseovarius sp. S1123]|uniref:glycosyltransferase family 2 protein n=1 Tax=unclassified Aliiroseovarius TaxID=2623558 RepID=UPI001FF32B8C|nr:glycosyltransferase family 2 protein [Aliiroseovarius sp. S1123]MCK0172483.1 glycosyltransferase family 2 protein [Aliiroseovarius sp. S1123]